MNFDELFQDFDLCAEESKVHLTDMLSVVSEGKVPSQESFNRLDLSIANLRVKYESFVEAVTSQLTEDEKPCENAAAGEYYEALKSSRSARLKRQIESSRDCLQKFLRVRSLVAAYAEALSPIQAQASELLQSLNSGANIEIEEAEKSTAGPKALLAAVACSDKDSDEGITLCDRVAEFFPGRIYSGVVAGKYFIDDAVVLSNDNCSAEEKSVHLSEAENQNNAAGSSPAAPEVPAESGEEEAEDGKAHFDDGADCKESDAAASAFVNALSSAGCFYSEADFGTVDIETSPHESKKITSKEFRNEMKSGGFAAEKIIIEALHARNIVTLEHLTEVRKVPESAARFAFSYMFKKGYVRKYSISSVGYFYCASPRLQEALSYKDAAKIVGVRQRSLGDWGKSINDKAASVVSRICLSKLYDDSACRLKSGGAANYVETVFIGTESFCGRLFNANNPSDCEILAGAFWENDANCGHFLEVFNEIVSSCKGITAFVFAAQTLERAKGTVDALLSLHGNREALSPVCLYVLSEDAYYNYPSLARISKQDICGLPEDDSPEAEEQVPIDLEPADTEAETVAGGSAVGNDSGSEPDSLAGNSDICTETADDRAAGKESELLGNIESPAEPNEPSESLPEDIPAKDPPITPVREAENSPIDAVAEENPICRMVNSPSIPSDEEFFNVISDILSEKVGSKFSENSYIAQALLLAKAASYSPGHVKCRALYRQLQLALKAPLEKIPYTSENLSAELTDDSPEAIILSSYLFALLIPDTAYDYGLKSRAEEYLESYDISFPALSAVKPLFAKLNTVRDVVPAGFSEAVLVKLGSRTESEKYAKSIQSQARDLLSVSIPKTRMKALPALYNTCFGKGSELYFCLEIAAKGEASKDDVELVRSILSDYCDEQEGILSISEEKTGRKLDAVWFKVNGAGTTFALEYAARQQALRQINNRLSVIRAWIETVAEVPGRKYDCGRIRTLRDEIIRLSKKACADISDTAVEYKAVIVWALKTICRYLTDPNYATDSLFAELAYTGVISLDSEMLPVLPEDLDSVKYCEPWRAVLKHILSPVRSLEDAKEEILEGGESSDLFDNLRQLEIIGNLTGEQLGSSEEQIEAAEDTARGNSKEFDDALELAYTYNRISETEKENLAAIKHQHEEAFFKRKDFGIWRQFLRALMKRMDELTDIRQSELQRMLDARYTNANGKGSPILKEAQVLLCKDRNFAVAEEYINRFDNGEEDFSEELRAVLHETDHFAEFISDDVFKPIWDVCNRCRDMSFHKVARDYLSKNFPADWTARLKDDSLRFVGKDPKSDKYWPVRKNTSSPDQIKSLFNWFGMNIVKAEKVTGCFEEMFRLNVVPSPRSMTDYRHPISLFGTQAKSQMNVILLYGNVPAKQLVDKINGLGLGTMSIVILNYPVTLAVRRQIAEEFHKTTGHNPFILIDQTLAIYLALHQITERLPILLKCSLPYATYQPFVRDGGSTADEMFFGRTKELATIKDPNGACVVYGGRQLGKTALLERAESLCFKPENRAYAVYCNILNCTSEESMVQKVSEDVLKKTGFKFQRINTIQDLCNEFENLFRAGKMESMLLLLDETDKFLEAIAGQDYAQLQPLIDLKRSTKNRFKFVLAGLHNVCRAKNATARNGVFGQLGTPLCVKPLSPTDALQLLSRPLRYLGFQIDRHPHLETILTNTNYYPGILQFFGYMLVETLSTHYGKYYRAVDGNPPYTLQDDQLGAVMNSADLNRSIRDKFRWSLELDPRYFMLARCIVVLYYLNEESANTWMGFSIHEIMETATDYGICCLRNESENDYKNLLDEMVEMGILSKPDAEKNLYRLRRSSFINIIGSDFEAVDADIIRNNSEVVE